MNIKEIFSKDISIYETWRLCNAGHPDLPAIEYFGNQWTFCETNEMIDVYARAFMQMLPEKTKSVTFCVPTLPSALFAFYALNKMGIRANIVSHTILPSDPKVYIEETDTDILIILDKFYPDVVSEVSKTKVKTVVIVSLIDDVSDSFKLIQQIRLSSPELKHVPSFLIKSKLKSAFRKIKTKYAVSGIEVVNLSEFISLSKSNTTQVAKYTPNETAVVLYTGGSTGVPKGVEIINETANRFSDIYAELLPMSPGDRNLILIPPNHPTSFMISVIMPWRYGATQVLQPIYDKNTFAYDLTNSKAQITMAAPSHYATLISSSLKDRDLSFLKYAMSGGEPVSYELASKINSVFQRAGMEYPWLGLGYGMSELGPTVISSSLSIASSLCNKVGSPLPGVEIRIVDDSGITLGDNKKGNLEIKTPYRMKGYFKQPELTKAFFTEDGYAKTGDIAIRDENGYYDVLGRASDSIVAHDGSKVYLFDIERVVYKDIAVLECEVVGLEANGAKVPVVHIVLNVDYAAKVEETILRIHNLCREHLSENEMPHGYKIREAFGTNPISAKRDYRALELERDGFLMPDGDGVRDVSF